MRTKKGNFGITKLIKRAARIGGHDLKRGLKRRSRERKHLKAELRKEELRQNRLRIASESRNLAAQRKEARNKVMQNREMRQGDKNVKKHVEWVEYRESLRPKYKMLPAGQATQSQSSSQSKSQPSPKPEPIVIKIKSQPKTEGNPTRLALPQYSLTTTSAKPPKAWYED